MRVLHIFNEIKFSGAEIMYASAAKNFQQAGIEIIAVSTGEKPGDFSPQFEKENIKVYHLPILNSQWNPIFIYKYFSKILTLIDSEKIDVIHIHRGTFKWFFALCGFLKKKNQVYTVHNVIRSRFLTWPKAYLERLTARKIFKLRMQSISESVYQNELHYYKNPSVKVNNWYNSNKFYPAAFAQERDEIRAKLGIPTEAFVIISTGGCSLVKNHHDIIKALPLIKKQFPCVYLHLGEGQTMSDECSLAKQLLVEDDVKFIGNVVDVRSYLIASDIYIMPSMYEGLGNAAIEAMACAKPAILYNSPGLVDLIENDNNGCLIPHDHRILAEKIIFFKNNPDVMKVKGNSAKEFVMKDFFMETSVAKIIELYKK